MPAIRTSAWILMLLLLPASLAAQGDGGRGSTSTSGRPTSGGSGGSFYNYSDEAGLSIDVNLWGFVNAPGRYRVPASTTLIELISLAGGPSDRARLSDVSVLHDMTVDSTIKEPVDVFNLEEYKRTGNPSLNRVLIQNDTVVVPGDALNVFREILSIFSDIAVVVSTATALILAFQR